MKLNHWEKIYLNKNDDQLSWTESYPQVAIDHILSLDFPLSAQIIDVGGGTGFFVSALLDLGYKNITVLDISATALEKSKVKLGERSSLVNWIAEDITQFAPERSYDFWYDRAVFHFLKSKNDINSYIDVVNKSVKSGGNMLIGTFSENGPLKCSGLEVSRYSSEDLEQVFSDTFNSTHSFKYIHTTPFETAQEFQFNGFKKV